VLSAHAEIRVRQMSYPDLLNIGNTGKKGSNSQIGNNGQKLVGATKYLRKQRQKRPGNYSSSGLSLTCRTLTQSTRERLVVLREPPSIHLFPLYKKPTDGMYVGV